MAGIEMRTGLTKYPRKPKAEKPEPQSDTAQDVNLVVKKPRYSKKRILVNWDGHVTGQKAKMLAHVSAERTVGASAMEKERIFGTIAFELALDACLDEKVLPGFVDWYKSESGGEEPTVYDSKNKMRRAAYLLRCRIVNSVTNPKGDPAKGSNASRSKEHYMDETKTDLRQWEEWAEKALNKKHGYRKRKP